MVGDLSMLSALADELDAAGAARREAAAAAREAARVADDGGPLGIVEAAEGLAGSTQWKASGERFKELQDQWTALPRGDRSTRDAEQELWKRFSAARSTFDKARRGHFATLDAARKEATAAKEGIIARAEALSTSTDWADTARAYRGLMDEWKAAPRAGRTDEDKLWARFRGAQDAFFAARNAAQSERDGDQAENARAKEALAAEAEALLPITRPRGRADGDRAASASGGPPSGMCRAGTGTGSRVACAGSRRPCKRYEEDQWRRTDPAKRALAESTVETFRASLAKLEKQAAAAASAGDERRGGGPGGPDRPDQVAAGGGGEVAGRVLRLTRPDATSSDRARTSPPSGATRGSHPRTRYTR